MFAPFFAVLLAFLASIAMTSPASALCVCLKCLTGYWTSHQVEGIDMLPSFEDGDCVVLRTGGQVERGDVVEVEFTLPPSLIGLQRVIGLPGDKVELRDSVVFLNDKPRPRQEIAPLVFTSNPISAEDILRCGAEWLSGNICMRRRFIETLPNGTSYEIIESRLDIHSVENFGPIILRKEELFVLRDFRDSGNDSRMMGNDSLVDRANGKGFDLVSYSNVSGLLKASFAP